MLAFYSMYAICKSYMYIRFNEIIAELYLIVKQNLNFNEYTIMLSDEG